MVAQQFAPQSLERPPKRVNATHQQKISFFSIVPGRCRATTLMVRRTTPAGQCTSMR
jgi:hypothetical protein